MILVLVSLLFLLVYGLLFAYYHRGWHAAGYFEPKNEVDHRFISVIVPARNEEKNIKMKDGSQPTLGMTNLIK